MKILYPTALLCSFTVFMAAIIIIIIAIIIFISLLSSMLLFMIPNVSALPISEGAGWEKIHL